MSFHAQYGLTQVINACGKMTKLSNARVPPDIAGTAHASLGHFFFADELQELASARIARFSGAQSGCVTACSAAGITLSIAACMTGNDGNKVARLPATDGMPNEVVLQKGHAVNFGAPITQMVRLAGAHPVEVGTVGGTTREELEGAVNERTAAVLFVVSHHTVRFGCVSLAEVVRIAHAKGVPVVVDAAAQSFNLRRIVATGADLVVCSGHKYLSGTVSGLVCGSKDLIQAVLLQNRGIGRPMKVGKEGIFGLIAALDARERLDVGAFSKDVRVRVDRVCAALGAHEGVRTEVTLDANDNPFCRARVWIDADAAGVDAAAIVRGAAAGRPAVILRAHHTDEGYFDVDVIELTDDELTLVIHRIQSLLTATPAEKAAMGSGKPVNPRTQWLGEVEP